MTIKTRNRINFVFCIIYLAFFSLYAFHFIYQLANNNLTFPEIFLSSEVSTNIFFGYNPYAILIGLILFSTFITFASIAILRAFSKTNSSILVFFHLFLFACFCDTLRLFLIFANSMSNYTRFLYIMGNITLFARILAPLSLMMTIFMTYDEQPQNLNRNILLVILAALFMSFIIPNNTTKILPNFCVSYSFRKTLITFSVVTAIADVVSLAIFNYKNDNKQKTLVGFILITVGYIILFDALSIFTFLLGGITFAAGSYIYLYQLHNEFLWQ